MMNNYYRLLSVLLFLCFCTALAAQSEKRNCLADREYKEIIRQFPTLKSQRQQAVETIDRYRSEHSGSILYREEITIPVVVHVVYRLPEQNISDQQVISQIDALNRDFNLRNGNRFKIQEQFKPFMADLGISFCLANRDPEGNSTSGIIRTETTVENVGTAEVGQRTAIHHDDLGGSDAWDEEQYLNLWVGELGGFLGIGKYPEASLPGEDGVVIDPKYFGTIGTALENRPFHKGKTTTHEVGHYFNLLHPWGLEQGDCDEDDHIEDTPLQANPNYFCPFGEAFSCGSPDMFLNYMDYTNDPCLALFTHGQSDMIMATLQTVRSGLLQSEGCSFDDGPSRLAERFKIYFRSADRRLLIERKLAESRPVDLRVFNQLGQIVARADRIEQRLYIVDAVPASGVYFVELSSDSGESILRKVVAVQK